MQNTAAKAVVILGTATLLTACGNGNANDSACDAITAASQVITRCPDDPTRPARCTPFVGGPTRDSAGTIVGCDAVWGCPEGEMGLTCSAQGAEFSCTCWQDQEQHASFTSSWVPCERESAAIDVARTNCGWDVP